MSKYSPTSQKKLIVMSVLTLFTMSLALVFEKELDHKAPIEKELKINGVLNQNHIKMHFQQ
ncbi:hypothetical protein [Flammeovirga agarivorans]|uniref:Uncharacterized protein n=1 Tax=Flammeovirga agarivorans TaxID=2726742 RepID=A0A7X8XY85_9BACT|nr:hypothetical protein [Flammeovirga agarivorans]NLR93977.1 hypothetical protein [Flammeovirga agarivorans]